MELPKVKNQHKQDELFMIGIEVLEAFMIQIMTLRLFIETRGRIVLCFFAKSSLNIIFAPERLDENLSEGFIENPQLSKVATGIYFNKNMKTG